MVKDWFKLFELSATEAFAKELPIYEIINFILN